MEEDYEASDTEQENSRPPLKPLLCFVDLECSVNEKKEFEVHKSGCTYEDDDTFYAADMVEEMLQDLKKTRS